LEYNNNWQNTRWTHVVSNQIFRQQRNFKRIL
jgi:hypothetical protein